MAMPELEALSKEEIEYYENIDRCAIEAIDQPIKNTAPAHACYLMTKMLSLASDSVWLYTGELVRQAKDGTEVYSSKELLHALKSFLKQENKPRFSIVIEHAVDGGIESHPLVKAIKALYADKELKGFVDIRQLTGEAVFKNHFMVMDDSAYRAELDHNPCSARANFGDFKMAEKLSKLFGHLADESKSIFSLGPT